jgi:YihY family inner membrane protein
VVLIPAGDKTATDALSNTKDPAPEQADSALPDDGWWPQTRALLKYLGGTEVHTYAFSVAANVILSLFPFLVLMLTIAQRVFHSRAMVLALGELMKSLLPRDADFVMRNMAILVHPHRSVQLVSVVTLLITSTGVFLPLEVALNNVWGVKSHRTYLENQMVSLGLAMAVAVLVMASVALTAGQQNLTGWVFAGKVDGFVFSVATRGLLNLCAVVASILMFFLIYWILPHRRIPARAVMPTAIVVGLLWELAKYLYVLALPRLDFESVYGPFHRTVGLMMWAFLSGLLLLAGAHFSATRYTRRLASEADPHADADSPANSPDTPGGHAAIVLIALDSHGGSIARSSEN